MALQIESGEGDFCEPAETINVVAGTNSYNLATLMSFSPVKVRLVERNYNDDWVVLKKWEKNDGTIYTPGISVSDFFPTFRFTGTSLVFNQIPNFAQTAGIRVEGYKMPAEMSGDAATPHANFHAINHRLLVLYATVGCIESKEFTGMEGDANMFRWRLQKHEDKFLNIINNRSESPESVAPFGLSGDY